MKRVRVCFALASVLIVGVAALALAGDSRSASVSRKNPNDQVTWDTTEPGDAGAVREVSIGVAGKITKLNPIGFDPEAGSDWRIESGGVGEAFVKYAGSQKPLVDAKRYEPTFSGAANENRGRGGRGRAPKPYNWEVAGKYATGKVTVSIVLEDPQTAGVRAGLNRSTLAVSLNGRALEANDLTIEEETERVDGKNIITKLTVTYDAPFNRLNLNGTNIVKADINDNVDNKMDQVEKSFTLKLKK